MNAPLDSIRVLHVDDDADLAATAAAVLERQDERLAVTTATSASAGLEILDEDRIDCIVSDYEMPGADGLDFLESVREADPDVPFILYTGKGSEEIASEAISAGVTDYLQKERGTEQFELLANRIVEAVERVRSRLSYREVFEKSRIGLTVREIDDFELIDANRHYCELMGYDVEELRELPLGALTADVEGYDGERALETSRIALEEGSHTFEWPHQPAEGDWIWVEVTIQTAEIEGRSVFLNSVRDITERKRKETELRETKDRLELALEGAELGVWDWAIGTDHITYDERWADMLGYSLDELEQDPSTWLDNIHPDDFEEVLAEVEAHRHGDTEFYEIDHRMSTKSGDWKWIRAMGHIVERDEDGEPVRAVGINQDITKRKEAQRALEAERDRFVQGPTVVFEWAVGSDWPVEYVSPNAESMLGYSAEALESGEVDFRSVIHGDDFERVAAEVTDAVAEGAERLTHEPYRVRTADGEIRWVLDHTVIVYEDGEPRTFLGYLVDITERKEFEQGLTALQSAAEDLWAATDRADVFEVLVETALEFLPFEYLRIATVEGDSLAMMATSDAETLEDHATTVPLDAEEYLSVRAYLAGESFLTRELDSAEVAGVADEYDSALTVPVGTHGVLQAFATGPSTFDERDRELTELLADHVRITLTRLEQEDRMREQREALRHENDRLEDFVRIVSHDLRNPLNVVDGHLELAKADGDEHLEQADAALDRAFELIDDLLSLAREGQAVGEREPVDLAELARQCWRNVDTGGAELVVEADAPIEADPSRCQQLLENLFRNAVEHGSSPDSKVGDDGLERDEADSSTGLTITVETTPWGFAVADDGPGIPEGDRERIFEAGYSTQADGTGFGLSIVQEIAEAHDWDVRVTESESGGARFEFDGVRHVE